MNLFRVAPRHSAVFFLRFPSAVFSSLSSLSAVVRITKRMGINNLIQQAEGAGGGMLNDGGVVRFEGAATFSENAALVSECTHVYGKEGMDGWTPQRNGGTAE